ncbi:MAG: hypothetical protein ABSH09_27430 [Bryobacteraceae bacterium]|jgi:hypothetical protein
MSTKVSNSYLGVVAVLAMFAGFAYAHNSHHDLNGTWKLVPTRSDFGGEPVIETGTVTINDREHNITISRSFTFDGANQTNSFSFTTDGRENATIREGKDFKSKAKWDGDVLVVNTTQDAATSSERYELAPDGFLRLFVERSGHRPVTLYFQRQ